MTSTVANLVDRLLLDPGPDVAVALVREVDAAPESDRRAAIDRLESHLRARPEHRSRDIAAALIALRRAGGVL
jgi:hypothetical protein